MNLLLDELIRRLAQEPSFLEQARSAPDATAASTGVSPADFNAAVRGDLAALYGSGAHPLLVMKLAGALGIDPMTCFGGDEDAPPATRTEGKRTCQ